MIYALALVAVLLKAEPPVSVGLYAQWGSGKTFFMSKWPPVCGKTFLRPSS